MFSFSAASKSAGLSAFLYGRGKSLGELSRFLLVRGLWLILIDLTLIKFGWRFELDLYRLSAGVIFVIGASMVALSALIFVYFRFVVLAGMLHRGEHSLRKEQFQESLKRTRISSSGRRSSIFASRVDTDRPPSCHRYQPPLTIRVTMAITATRTTRPKMDPGSI